MGGKRIERKKKSRKVLALNRNILLDDGAINN